MALSAEAVSVIRARLDASAYTAGAEQVARANESMMASGNRVTQTATNLRRTMTDNGSAYERLKRQVDQVYSAEQRWAQVQEIVQRAVLNNRATQEDAARTLAMWRTRLDEQSRVNEVFAISNGKAAVAMRTLGTQAYDVFGQIAAGASITQTFIQQGSQIAQVAQVQGTSMRDFGAGLRAVFTSISPLTWGIAGFVTVLTTLSVVAETTNRRMNELRNSLVGIRPDAAALAYPVRDAARGLSARTDMSVNSAQGMIGTVFNAPIFKGTADQASEIAETFYRLNLALKKTGDDTSTLRDALQEPSRLIADLASRGFRGFSQSMIDVAQRLEAEGKQHQVFAMILEALKDVTKDVSGNITPLQEAMRKLDDTFVKLMGTGEGLAVTIGSKLNDALAAAIGWFDRFINHLGGRDANGTPYTEGGTPPGTTSGRTPPPELVPILDQAAQRFGLDPEFLKALQRNEGVFKDGAWQNSPTGARGPMQVLTGTFDWMTNRLPDIRNVNDPRDNVMAGAGYLAHLLDKYKDPKLAILAYHDGPGRVDRILEGKAEASQEGLTHVRRVMAGYSGTGFGPRMQGALEPPGPAYTSTAEGTAESPVATGTRAAVAAAEPGKYGLGENVDRAIEKAREYAKAQNLIVDSDDRLMAARKALTVALDDARERMDTRSIVEYSQALKALEGETYRTVSPQEDLVRGLERQAQVAGIVTEADRRLAETRQQLAQLDREHPEAATTDLQRARALGAVMSQLSGQYRVLSFEIDVQTRGQQTIAAGWLQSSDAGRRAEASVRAYNDALKIAPMGTQQFAAAVEALTQKYMDLARAASEAKFAQQVDTNRRQVDYLKTENDTLGMNYRQRELLLNQKRSEMELTAAGIPIQSELAKTYIDSQQAVADTTLTMAQNKKALDEISGSFTQSFDTIGNAITNALMNGNGAAVNWRNVMTSVAQQVLQAFMKLAIINPLLNELFGQNNTTLGGLFSALEGKGMGGSGGSGGGGGGGMLGGLFGLFGKLFGGGAGAAGAVAAPIEASVGMLNEGGVGMFGLLGAIHGGGRVGITSPTFMKAVDLSVFDTAPRFHTGLSADEFPAILQHGERVLTENQSDRVDRVLNAVGDESRVAGPAPTIIMNIQTPNADSFRRSQGQTMQAAAAALKSAQRKAGVRG